MKYEMIFGDPQLFNHAPDDAVLVSVQYGDFIYFTEQNLQQCKSFNINKYQRCDTKLAMRRIIQEPKRWTVEDQDAGRLPEVGAEFQTSAGKRKCVITEGKFIFTVNDDAIEVYTIESAMPLETPEEKAERLREEWCSKALDSAGLLSEMKRYDLKRLSEYISSIHDAMLSGALSAPTKGGE